MARTKLLPAVYNNKGYEMYKRQIKTVRNTPDARQRLDSQLKANMGIRSLTNAGLEGSLGSAWYPRVVVNPIANSRECN